MKAEDKILELLAEYLKKTDQTIEQMDLANKRMDESNKRMDLAYDVLIKHSEELIDLRKELIKREVQQDVLLKEILSISRRVGNLEDNR